MWQARKHLKITKLQPERQHDNNTDVKTVLGLNGIHTFFSMGEEERVQKTYYCIYIAKHQCPTSKRRLFSLTVVPRGRPPFLGAGLECAGLVMCFLEVFSWFTVRHKTWRLNRLRATCGFEETETSKQMWSVWSEVQMIKKAEEEENHKDSFGMHVGIFATIKINDH